MAAYAHYALHKLKILPGIFSELPVPEKAFIIASIKHKVEKEKKEAQSLKARTRR